jgi:hypothetical protein
MRREPNDALESSKPQELPEYLEDEVTGVRKRPLPDITAQERDAGKKRREELVKRDDERARQLERLIQQVESDVPPDKRDELAPAVPDEPNIKPGFLSRLGLDLRKNRLFKAALVAAGLHTPLSPAGQRVLKDAIERVQSKTEWEKPGMEIRPQNQAERDAVVAKMYENGARSDAKARDETKDWLSSRLDQGQEVPLDEMYFKLAKTAGEDPERIKEAGERKDQLVERLAARMGGEMSETFIRSVVDEMYGSDANYDWGQASVTEYFMTGKRNCAAIARAEQMVFESLLAKLPPEKRKLYQLGLAMEKQHEIATLVFLNDDGSVNRTIYLQPPTRIVQGARDEAGVPNISMETVKRAMVSKAPIAVRAPEKPGEEVDDSPDIDIITVDPVQLNLKVEGKLRGSDYVVRVAEERGIKPVKAPPEKLIGVQEMDIESYRGNDGERAEKAQEIRRHAEETIAGFDQDSKFVVDIDASGMRTAEEFRILNDWHSDRFPGQIKISYIGELDEPAIAELAKTPADEILFAQPIGFLGNQEDLLAETRLRQLARTLVERRAAGEKIPRLRMCAAHAEDVSYLTGEERLPEIAIEYIYRYRGEDCAEEFTQLEKMPIAQIYLGGTLGFEQLEMLSRGKKTSRISAEVYIDILMNHPEIADYKNVKPWVDGEITLGPEMLINGTEIRNHPGAARVLKAIIKEAGSKYGYRSFEAEDLPRVNRVKQKN